MSNTRFGLTNYATNGIATLLNGTGGGAPARHEDANFPMENALRQDRYTPWKTDAAPGITVQLDVDLGSAKSIACGAAHGFTLPSGSVANNFKLYSGSAYPTFAQRGSTVSLLSFQPRDYSAFFSPVSARFWRFEWNLFSGPFRLGHLFLGPLVDLGQAHSVTGG
jgi:hypothetical protein